MLFTFQVLFMQSATFHAWKTTCLHSCTTKHICVDRCTTYTHMHHMHQQTHMCTTKHHQDRCCLPGHASIQNKDQWIKAVLQPWPGSVFQGTIPGPHWREGCICSNHDILLSLGESGRHFSEFPANSSDTICLHSGKCWVKDQDWELEFCQGAGYHVLRFKWSNQPTNMIT